MKSKNLIYALLITVIAIFTSCEKDDANSVESQACSNMLYFDSEEELVAEMNKVSKMTLEEKVQWEKSKGFNSIEIAAERLYKSINPDNFKSKEEVVSFVEKNSEYLQLIEDENGEFELETKFWNRSNRYFLNENNMYQVGDSVYKVLATGTIIGNTKDLDSFYQIGNDIDYSVSSNFLFIPKDNYNKTIEKSIEYSDCGTSQTWRSTTDDERLKIEIEVYKSGSNSVTCHFISRPYIKILGIWYWCSRKMKADIKLEFRYFSRISNNPGTLGWRNNELVFYNDFLDVSKFEDSETFTATDVCDNGDYSPRFNSYDVWGDTYKVAEIDADCTIY